MVIRDGCAQHEPLGKGKGDTRAEEAPRRTLKIARHYSKGLLDERGAITYPPTKKGPMERLANGISTLMGSVGRWVF